MSDVASVYSVSYPKARREHRCCECNRIIKPGEEYQLYKGCWDGKWSDYKTCQECADQRDDYVKDHDLRMDEGVPFGSLGEYLNCDDLEFIYHDKDGCPLSPEEK